jgi:type IV secretion system protein VirB10
VPQKAQDANSRFPRSVSSGSVAVSRAEQLEDLEHTLLKGKMIEAVTAQRALSDLPGTLCATVQCDVFGNQGRILLIPWGSRLCGVYSADGRRAQVPLALDLHRRV